MEAICDVEQSFARMYTAREKVCQLSEKPKLLKEQRAYSCDATDLADRAETTKAGVTSMIDELVAATTNLLARAAILKVETVCSRLADVLACEVSNLCRDIAGSLKVAGGAVQRAFKASYLDIAHIAEAFKTSPSGPVASQKTVVPYVAPSAIIGLDIDTAGPPLPQFKNADVEMQYAPAGTTSTVPPSPPSGAIDPSQIVDDA